jgi:hypothetical protein
MRKLWIVTELFYPDETSTSYILSNIANKLIEKYEVNVISGSALYQKNKVIENNTFCLDDKINVFKVYNKAFDKNSILQRTLKIILLTINLSYSLLKKVNKDDKVFIVTNPAPLLIVISILKSFKKFELSILVHDVFPENTIPARIIKTNSSIIYRIIKPFFNKAYSSADSLIVLGRDMKDVFIDKLSKYRKIPNIEIIENWGDTINIKPYKYETSKISLRHDNNIVTIQYAGNIGRTQGLKEFIEILAKTTSNIHLDVWGDGAMKEEIINFVNNNNIKNKISFYGYYSRTEQNDILNSTDISLVTLADGMYGLGVPSKAYNIIASGKPILFIGKLNSEIALMIQEEEIGFCFDPTDSIAIDKFLNEISVSKIQDFKIMGDKARRIAENIYSEKRILDKYVTIL